MFEKILKAGLVNFLEREGFYSRNQYGFKKKLNNENAFLDFLGKFLKE